MWSLAWDKKCVASASTVGRAYHTNRGDQMNKTQILIITIALLLSSAIVVMAAQKQSTNFVNDTNTPELSNKSITVYALAVGNKGGKVIPVTLQLIDGNGRLLLDVSDPILYTDTQQSARIALEVAQKYTGINLKNKDLIISISEQGVVSGPSAGALLTTGIIALLENKDLNKQVTMTGQILPNGSIYPVGGLVEKADAAKAKGFTKILVPKGESIQRIPEKKCEKKEAPGIYIEKCYINYKEQPLEDMVGIKVQEVENIDQAVKEMII